MSDRIVSRWANAKLTDVAQVWFSGVDKKSSPDEESIRLCNYVDVFRNREIRMQIDFMKATATKDEIKRNRLLEGDVVFTKDSETSSDIAQCAFVAESSNDLVCGYHLAIARPDSTRLLGSYLAFLMRFPRVRQQLVRSANGVVRYGLTMDAISDFTIALPSVDEQRRIVNILNTWDKAIENIDRLILLRKKNMTSTSTKILWEDRDDWRPLSDYIEPSRDRVGNNRSLEVYSVTRDGLKPQLEQFNKRIANEDIARHMLLKPNEFALSGLNFWLGSVAVSHLKHDVCISPDYKVFRFKPTASAEYFRHLVRTAGFREILSSCSTERASVVRKNFNRELFLESEVPVPPLAEQEKRATILNAVAFELRKTEAYRALLENQKRGLMQKLLTGEWRLDERFDAEALSPRPLNVGGRS